MNEYRVLILDQALHRLNKFLDYIAEDKQSPETAQLWLKKALTRVRSLKRHPYRCPYAPENADRDYEIRMLIIDRCLFLYNVNDRDRVVRILSFRHGSQLPDSRDLPAEI